jgi:hypothetical protein
MNGTTRGTGRMNRRGRDGAIIAMVLVMLVVLSIFGIGLLGLSSTLAVETGRSVGSVQAFWTAEAGLEQAKTIADKRRRPFSQILKPGGGFMVGSNVLSGTTAYGSFAVDVLDDPGWTNATATLQRHIIQVRSTANNGARQTVSMRSLIQSFASYMHASHDENGVSFGTGDVIDGPVYVNDQVRINGTPRFLQSVNSAASSVRYSNGGNSSVFEGGLTLNAPELNLDDQWSTNYLGVVEAAAADDGLTLTGDYQFNFNADGTLSYALKSGSGTTTTVSLATLNDGLGAIYVNGDVYVNGVVNGAVTIAASDAIYISNSIQYASAVSPNPWSTNTFNANAVDDKLGLIARNQVQIRGTNAVTIHAAIMVTTDGGGFNAQYYTTEIGKPNINLYGSLTQYERGAVGQASSPWRGYAKNYKFDVRFRTDAPPHFPFSMFRFQGWSQATR